MSNSLPKLLITGGNGQLASALRHHRCASQYQMICCSREQLDVTDPCSIRDTITHFQPDIIINTAAYTAVDQAEQDTKRALSINYEGAQHLAQRCAQTNTPLIHLSTDYVFAGTQTIPYHENSSPHPINFYGQSKWLGEQAVRDHCAHHLILRISSVFSEYGHNFLKTILRLAQKKNELRIVADQISCPTYAGDIAGTLFSIIKQPLVWGTYHYCSYEPVSWYQFAIAIIDEIRTYSSATVQIKPITTAEYLTAAQRPAYSVLDCRKINNLFKIPLTSWRSGLKKSIYAYYRCPIPS